MAGFSNKTVSVVCFFFAHTISELCRSRQSGELFYWFSFGVIIPPPSTSPTPTQLHLHRNPSSLFTHPQPQSPHFRHPHFIDPFPPQKREILIHTPLSRWFPQLFKVRTYPTPIHRPPPEKFRAIPPAGFIFALWPSKRPFRRCPSPPLPCLALVFIPITATFDGS